MGRLADRIADAIASYVDKAIRQIPAVTAAGTVVTSPSQVTTDPLTVVIDGSSLAVPVKQVRGLPLVAGARVVLVKFGSDWSIVGSLTNPAIGTNTSRMVIGADTPAELKAYGIDTAILSYLTDKTSGLEVGYFFIGCSNRFDGNGDNRVQAFGNVLYPTAGDPSSAVVGSVKTNFQQQLFQPYPQTIFKDQKVELWTDFNLRTQNGFGRMTVGDSVDNLVVNIDANGIKGAQPSSGVIETWHDFVYQNLWANSAAGQVTGRYRKLASPANSIQLVGECAAGTKADTTIITNLPVGYRPAKGTTFPIAVNPSTAAGSTTPLLQLKANGDLICFGLVAATGTVYFSAVLPLDA